LNIFTFDCHYCQILHLYTIFKLIGLAVFVRASQTDRQTDGQTDEWMDGWTSPSLKPPFYSVGRELSNW